MADVKEFYDKVSKKYGLPEYGRLDAYFQVSEVDSPEHFLLRKIRIRITEKAEFVAKHIASIIQPETTLTGMYESKFFTRENDKNDAYQLFKRLTHICKASVEQSVENDEKENAQFIIESFKEWESMKGDIKAFFSKVKDYWGTETDIKDDLSYLG